MFQERSPPARDFEETLTVAQLLDLVKRGIKPDHWQDGVVSYFRVSKVIEMLRQLNEPINPSLDIAISILSDKKCKIRNQTHAEFCRYIKSQMDKVEEQTDEDLQQQVERLMPGCVPIGPECEALGITGDMFLDDASSIPTPLDPKVITNRVIFELSQYLLRIKESHENMAKVLQRMLGLESAQGLTGEVVAEWCSNLQKEVSRRRKKSMSQAQQYLTETFLFPGMEDLVLPSAHPRGREEDAGIVENADGREENAGIVTSTVQEVEEGKEEMTEGGGVAPEKDKYEEKTDGIDVEFSEDEKEAAQVDIPKVPEEEMSTDTSTPKKEDLLQADHHSENELVKEDEEDIAKDDQEENEIEMNEKEGNEEEEKEDTIEEADSIEKPPRDRPSRSSAEKAKAKIVQPRKQSTQESVIDKDGKSPSRNTSRDMQKRIVLPSKSLRNKSGTNRVAPQKKKCRDGDKEEEEDNSSDEEDIPVRNSERQKSAGSVNKGVSEAVQTLLSVSKLLKKLKSEMKITFQYLEAETERVFKNLAQAKEQLEKAAKLMNTRERRADSKDEKSDVEQPSRATRSEKTKKITVTVEPGVKKTLKQSLVKLTPLVCQDSGDSDDFNETEHAPAQIQRARRSAPLRKKPEIVSRRRADMAKTPGRRRQDYNHSSQEHLAGPSSRTVRRKGLKTEPIRSFDKGKLLCSKVCIQLVRLEEDVLKRLEKGSVYHLDSSSDENEDSPIGRRSQSRSKRVPRRSKDISSSESMEEDSNDDDMKSDDNDSPVTRSGNARKRQLDTDSSEGEGCSRPSRRRGRTSPSRSKSGRNSKDSPKNVKRGSRTVQESSAKKQRKGNESGSLAATSSERSVRSGRSCPRRQAAGEKKSQGDDSKTPITNPSSRASKSTEWRGASTTPKAKVKKRSLTDFVQMLNNPKKGKVEGVKRTSPRSKAADAPDRKVVHTGEEDEEESSGREQEFDDDDFLEKKTKMALEKQKELEKQRELEKQKELEREPEKEPMSPGEVENLAEEQQSTENPVGQAGEESAAHEDESKKRAVGEQDGAAEEADGGVPGKASSEEDNIPVEQPVAMIGAEDNDMEIAYTQPQGDAGEQADYPSHAATGNGLDEIGDLEGAAGSEEDVPDSHGAINGEKALDETFSNQDSKDLDNGNKRGDKEEEFIGDAIVGRSIKHRRSVGKHGLYKWYVGKVVHKSTAAELLKLDEEQFNHLNNCYTFYSVQYEDTQDAQPKALEVDWEQGNLKLL